MKRALLAVAIVVTAAHRAHAEDCPPPAAVDDTPRALAVELSPDVTTDGDWGPTIIASSGSRFPSISADGKTIVELFADQEDFVGTPIATAVFYTKGGKKAFQWTSGQADRRGAEQVVKAINARLAETKWRALPVATGCPTDDAASKTVATLGDARVTFDFDEQNVTVERAGKKTTARFPAAGAIIERDLGHGGCGEVVAIERAFRAKDFVVVEPRVNLGGDSCFGSPLADVAITARMP